VKSFFTPLFMSSVGNRRQIALTQVTPSAQVAIKAGYHAGHLRSSTITGKLLRFSFAAPPGDEAANLS
jgi:hypothetical protein